MEEAGTYRFDLLTTSPPCIQDKTLGKPLSCHEATNYFIHKQSANQGSGKHFFEMVRPVRCGFVNDGLATPININNDVKNDVSAHFVTEENSGENHIPSPAHSVPLCVALQT